MNIFTETNPWAQLEESSTGESILSKGCSVKYIHSLYIGYDKLGRYMFLLKLPEGAKGIADQELPMIKGCASEFFEYNASTFFSLTLSDKQNWRLFKLLCQEIITEIENHTKQENLYLLKILSEILKKCGRFFAKSRDAFTREKAVGLFGELYFLHKVAAPIHGLKTAIAAWKGPLGFPQDFSIDDTVIEVKTTESAQRQTIKISNEEQLSFEDIKGYLYVLTINESPNNTIAQSLNTLIKEILTQCETEGIDVTDICTKLDLMDYSESSSFSKKEYTVVTETSYRVHNDFPCITPQKLPQGIEHVKYSINLNLCEQFKQLPNWINND